jgi:hypothetical protein
MLHSYRLACLNVSTSSHFKHFHHSILQQANIVVDQNSLVDSTSLAHQANQREVTTSSQYNSMQASQRQRYLLRDLPCVNVSVAIPFEGDNTLADAVIVGIPTAHWS